MKPMTQGQIDLHEIAMSAKSNRSAPENSITFNYLGAQEDNPPD